MNAVIGMAHLALKRDLNPKQRDYLKKIQSSANSLLVIINDILDFSKIEAGKLDMEAVDFNLDDVLDNLANLVTVKAQEKENLEVLFAAAHDVPRYLVGDPLRLGQVLVNLANNAVKFTESGEIVVSIEKVERKEDQVRLKFVVSDTGLGLTEEQMSKLFQSFSQADTSTTRKYGGTGLGLAISKKLVHMMDGEIRVESQYGQGTSFIFDGIETAARIKNHPTLSKIPAIIQVTAYGREEIMQKAENSGLDGFLIKPVNASVLFDAIMQAFGEEIPETSRLTRRQKGADALQAIQGSRILLVEDNEINQQVAGEILEGAGLTDTIANNGREAVDAVKESDYDAVLMDLQMPVMDGYTATRKIRELESVSAYSDVLETEDLNTGTVGPEVCGTGKGYFQSLAVRSDSGLPGRKFPRCVFQR